MKNPGGPLPNVAKLLAEIEEALPLATWALGTVLPRDRGGVPFEGNAGEWHFVVIGFEVEGQRAYDGAARKSGTAPSSLPQLTVRFTPQLAERAFKLALTSAQKRDTNDSPRGE